MLHNLLYNVRYTRAGVFIGKVYNILTRENVCIVRRHGVLFELNNRVPAERAILFNIYEPKVTKIFLSLIDEDDIVVDAGAWIGYYTCLAANRCTNGKVITIEPHPENIARLKRHIVLNGFKNVILVEETLSDKESITDLIVSDHSVMHRLDHNNVINDNKKYDDRNNSISNKNNIKVRVTTLDNIADRCNIDHIDILMMDIEGYEYFALLGANNLLNNNKIHKIIMEVHTRYLKEMQLELDDIIESLESYNYTIEIIEHINDSIDRYHILAIRE